MKVKTVFHGILSDWIGTREALWDLPQGSRLEDLIKEIYERCHCRTPRQLWDPRKGTFIPQVLTTRNGIPLTVMEPPLSDNDEIHFLLLLAGG